MMVMHCLMDLTYGLLIWMAVHCILKLPPTDALKINGANSNSSTYLCNREVTLVCGANNPSDSMPPAISWAKDGITITQCFDTANNDCVDAVVGGHQYFTSDTTAKTYTLTFTNIRMESAAVWSCEDGSNPAQLTVSVIELPSITSTVSVTINGTSDVTLECKTNCVTTASSSIEVSWEYQDGSLVKTLTPIDGSTSTETSLPCSASGHCVLSTSEQHRRTAKFTTSSSCTTILQVRAKITTTDKQLTNGVDSDYIAYTGYISTCAQETVPSTTSPPEASTVLSVSYKKYRDEAVAVLVVLLLVVIFVLVVLTLILCGVLTLILCGGTEKIRRKDFIWKILYGVGVLDLVVVCVACGIHVHINTGDRDGALMPWYVIVAIVLTSLEFVAFAVSVLKKCSGKEKTEAENEDEELKVKCEEIKDK